MPDLDIRETARAEAERSIGGEIAKAWFVEGAQWAVDQLPDREELATAMFDAYADDTSSDFSYEGRGIRSLYLEQADAVLALIVEKLGATSTP